MSETEIVLCIPGPWEDQSDLVRAIAKESEGYLFAGRVLMNIDTHDSVELQFEEPDKRMLSAFMAAGPHWAVTPEMDRISTHKSVVYLISDGGSVEKAHAMMDAGNALLKAGGYGVKVESTGLAHTPKAWAEQCEYKYLYKSHSSYVIYITSDDVYSCGMHNFGLPDAIVSEKESESPVQLLRDFTFYIFSESPAIKDGQTFSADSESPRYKISSEKSIEYGEDSLFNNPYGMWRLSKLEN